MTCCECAKKAALLREALVGLVGTDDPVSLQRMEQFLLTHGGADQKNNVFAIRVLLQTNESGEGTE